MIKLLADIAKTSVFCGFLALGTSTAQAQFDIGGGFIDAGVHGAVMDGIANDHQEQFDSRIQQRPQPEISEAERKRKLVFSASNSRRQKNYSHIIGVAEKKDAASGAEMKRWLGSQDVVSLVGQSIAPLGLKTNNIADAYTIWWINAWDAANGIDEMRSRAVVQKVKEQAEDAFIQNPSVYDASAAQKQQMADGFLVQTALTSAMYERVKNDPAKLKDYQNSLRTGAKEAGMDLDMFMLTDDGFKPRQGSDASDAVPAIPGEEAEALAVVDDTDDNTTTYALIAAAGGAGLVAAFAIGKMMGRRG